MRHIRIFSLIKACGKLCLMMKQLSLSISILCLIPALAFASKARQKALQADTLGLPLDRITGGSSDFPLVDQKDPKLPLEKLKLPEGVQVSVFAVVPDARSMALGEKGQVFVGTREDKVYRVWDQDLDGKADRVEVILDGLNSPNGVAYRKGDLFVGEIPRIIKIAKVNERKRSELKAEELPQKFPSDKHHGWKFMRFGPDGWLYVPVGANCNICETGTEYGRIFRINVDGKEKEEVAQGVRNTVGFDWNPADKVMWFTDNGRDMLGDDVPPDEINKISKKGEHFGYPYCHGKDIQDPEFNKNKKSCSEFTAPQALLGAHVAALGMRFVKDTIFVAEHGSWNRSSPLGYRIGRMKVVGGKAGKYEIWIEGWLQNGKPWGRPVDVQEYFDGSLLVSDDHAGVIYRVKGL